MLKKIGLGLMCAGMLMSSVSMANTQAMPMGTTLTYELQPNSPLELFNFMFWSISATCKIDTIDEADDIRATLLNRSGIINGQNLSEGEVFEITVHSRDLLHITAESRAKVELINLGEHKVSATCTA